MRVIKGHEPLPPSVLCLLPKGRDDVTSGVKVKRKCGRPRNPIPRHKRESHINAEHRRRGKIQDGFRTLKAVVPTFQETIGRDSKAEILLKAVDHCKALQQDTRDMTSHIRALQLEREELRVDIKNYEAAYPDIPECNQAPSIDGLYTDYVQRRSRENPAFGAFQILMRPLFESYKMAMGELTGSGTWAFVQSVVGWVEKSFTDTNMRTICSAALNQIPTKDHRPNSLTDHLTLPAQHPSHGCLPVCQETVNKNNTSPILPLTQPFYFTPTSFSSMHVMSPPRQSHLTPLQSFSSLHETLQPHADLTSASRSSSASSAPSTADNPNPDTRKEMAEESHQLFITSDKNRNLVSINWSHKNKHGHIIENNSRPFEGLQLHPEGVNSCHSMEDNSWHFPRMREISPSKNLDLCSTSSHSELQETLSRDNCTNLTKTSCEECTITNTHLPQFQSISMNLYKSKSPSSCMLGMHEDRIPKGETIHQPSGKSRPMSLVAELLRSKTDIPEMPPYLIL